MDSNPLIDWQAEQDRFMAVAFRRTMAAAHDAFSGWHRRKRADAVAEMTAKMWDQWSRLLIRGKDPEAMVGTLIKWAILWVRYDRKVAGRARSYDVMDYRAGMSRQQLSGQGTASPTDRSDPNNSWIDWDVRADDDPAEWASALEAAGLTSADLAA